MPEINGKTAISGTIYGTLSIRHGADGKDGQDGFSPRIVVAKHTETEYVLRITDVEGTFETPNLLGGGGGVDTEEVKRLVAGKLDANLADTTLIQSPRLLSTTQRQSAMLYVYRSDMEETEAKHRLSLYDVALREEVEDRINKKMRTVTSRPDDWKVGDYIFLEIPREDRK